MRCRIDGCGHRVKKTASPSRHVGQSWYDHGICSCCAIELFLMRSITGEYGVSQTCLRLVKEELQLIATTN